MKTLVTYIKWGHIGSDLSSESVPREFEAARSLWQAKKENALDEICALIQPFICCQFTAENFPGWEEYFDDGDSGFGEFPAKTIKLLQVDFNHGSIPSVIAEAWIDIALADKKTPADVDTWMEEIDDNLTWGVTFGWEFDGDDDLDLAMLDHRGAEADWVSE